jgi:hypothetical protein
MSPCKAWNAQDDSKGVDTDTNHTASATLPGAVDNLCGMTGCFYLTNFSA